MQRWSRGCQRSSQVGRDSRLGRLGCVLRALSVLQHWHAVARASWGPSPGEPLRHPSPAGVLAGTGGTSRLSQAGRWLVALSRGQEGATRQRQGEALLPLPENVGAPGRPPASCALPGCRPSNSARCLRPAPKMFQKAGTDLEGLVALSLLFMVSRIRLLLVASYLHQAPAHAKVQAGKQLR